MTDDGAGRASGSGVVSQERRRRFRLVNRMHGNGHDCLTATSSSSSSSSTLVLLLLLLVTVGCSIDAVELDSGLVAAATDQQPNMASFHAFWVAVLGRKLFLSSSSSHKHTHTHSATL